MKRFLLLLFIAIVTFGLFLLYKNPDVLRDIWLWLIGLAGVILKSLRSISDYFIDLFSKGKKQESNLPTENSNLDQGLPPLADLSVSILRYSDDGETSIGLLYLNDQFYCYTLEDTHRDSKVAGQTRIPEGIYGLDFKKELTPLTEKYRKRYPDWFSFHLELKDVKDFSSVYIHSGGDHKHTEGCILVSDSLSIGDKNIFLTNSRNTFKSLYLLLKKELESEKKIVLNIMNEDWFQNIAS